VVSYYHWLRTQTFDHPVVGLAKALPFAEFLREPLVVEGFVRNPYESYLCDGAGVEHAGAVYVRLEHLADDLAPVEAVCGFDIALTRANESARGRDWRPFYTNADAEQVAQFCAKDIARFGYVFDPEAA
jgi:putative transposase